VRLDRPFLRLPWTFDAQALAAEALALPADAWMAHPSALPGNSAVALVSRGGSDDHAFDGVMEETPHLRACPGLRRAMAAFGEVIGRSRLMRLAPGCEVPAHVDFNYHWRSRVRVHVPLVTEPAVRFRCGDAELHMSAGECWIFDSWRRHRVVHGGTHDRIHLVVDFAGSSRFWRTVRAVAAGGEGALAERMRTVPAQGEAPVELRTERWNRAPLMVPGEVEAIVRELLADLAAQPRNDPALLERYRDLLTDFAADWRELWLLHGGAPQALPHHRELVGALRRSLHPAPRALVTASNDVGANPIIVQRLLAPALPEDTPGS
jgi:hypothetical protein